MKVTSTLVRRLFFYNPITGALLWDQPLRRQSRVAYGMTAGYIDSNGARTVMIGGKNYKAHRIVWLYMTGKWPSGCIDHINGDPSDNRFANLRDVSRTVNQQNMRRSFNGKRSTPLLGAFPNHQRWMARIKIDGKDKYLGTFDTAEEAHAAYITAKRLLHVGCTI